MPTAARVSPEASALTHISSSNQISIEMLLKIHESTCARGTPLLTSAGVAYLLKLLEQIRTEAGFANGVIEVNTPARPNEFSPHWDEGSRCLWLGGILVKEFRQPAEHQIMILSAFQMNGWGHGPVDDPLSPVLGGPEDVAKCRLRDTIKNLNRALRSHTMRFRGDGTGKRVVWQLVDEFIDSGEPVD